MPTVRERVTERVANTIAEHRYPSHHMLDRLERSLRSRQDLEMYASMLLALTEGQRYPSLRMLARLDRCALAMELAERTHDREENDR